MGNFNCTHSNTVCVASSYLKLIFLQFVMSAHLIVPENMFSHPKNNGNLLFIVNCYNRYVA